MSPRDSAACQRWLRPAAKSGDSECPRAMLTALGEHASRALVTPDVPAPPQHACSKPQAWHRAATATNNGAGDPHKHTVRPCWLRPAVKSSDSECPRAMLTALGEHASRALVTPDVQAPNMLAQSRKHGTRPQRLPTMARVIHITTPCATAGFAQQRNPVIQNVPVPCSQLWVSMPPAHWSLRMCKPPACLLKAASMAQGRNGYQQWHG